jgi:hypothetical protein
MTRGLDRSTGKRSALLLVLLIACAQGCGEDETTAPGGHSGAGGQSGDGADGGDDASIEDASDGDSSIEEQSGGSGGSGGGESGTGGDGGESGSSGEGGESGDGGEPTLDGGEDIDSGAQDAVCFAGGDESESSATGACEDPIVIDMVELGFGDTLVHRTGSANTNGLVPSLDKCAEGTGRDVVFNVKTSGVADLEVSVDAVDGSDPIILVQDGPDIECDKSAATACVDDTAAGECEYLRVRVSAGGYEDNTPQVVIAETIHSGVAFDVRFRLIDPGGGS